MPGFLLRLFITAMGLGIASAIVPGLIVADFWSLLGAAFLLGLFNAVVRPILIVLTLPITVITLGLFLLVINAAMLALVAALMPGVSVSGFLAAVLASIIVSLVSSMASWYIGPQGRVEIMVHRE
ncbi:MAG: phage holin family protein [Pseudomonadota bacterium]|nr:phage holin family protein [Pseudomonadota bacterium]